MALRWTGGGSGGEGRLRALLLDSAVEIQPDEEDMQVASAVTFWNLLDECHDCEGEEKEMHGTSACLGGECW